MVGTVVQWRRRRKELALNLAVARLRARNRLSRSRVVQPGGPVVSLTSYSSRVSTVYLALETIGRNSVKPGRLILWLDERERYDNLPPTLRRLQARGLEIRLCDNLGPHKKYYPYIESESEFDVPLITADDDMLYPKEWIAGLMAAYARDPSAISCFRAREIGLDGSTLAPYEAWSLCTTTRPSLRHFATGASGVLYPPSYLASLKTAGQRFLETCPKADDLWLHVNAVRIGCKVQQVSDVARMFRHIRGTQDIALFRTNLNGGNDLQIARTYSAADIDALIAER